MAEELRPLKAARRHLSANHDHVLVFAKDAQLGTKSASKGRLSGSAIQEPGQRSSRPLDLRRLGGAKLLRPRNLQVDVADGEDMGRPTKRFMLAIVSGKLRRTRPAKERFGGTRDGDNMPRLKRSFSGVQVGVAAARHIWPQSRSGTTRSQKKKILLPTSATCGPVQHSRNRSGCTAHPGLRDKSTETWSLTLSRAPAQLAQ